MLGRPTLLTVELHKAIVNAVAGGMTRKAAAELSGISPDTLNEWVRRGESRDDRPENAAYAAFALDIKKAQAADQAIRIKRLQEAAKGGAVARRRTINKQNGDVVVEEMLSLPVWQADCWHLERTDPEHFSLNSGELRKMRAEIDELKRMVGHGATERDDGGAVGDTAASAEPPVESPAVVEAVPRPADGGVELPGG